MFVWRLTAHLPPPSKKRRRSSVPSSALIGTGTGHASTPTSASKLALSHRPIDASRNRATANTGASTLSSTATTSAATKRVPVTRRATVAKSVREQARTTTAAAIAAKVQQPSADAPLAPASPTPELATSKAPQPVAKPKSFLDDDDDDAGGQFKWASSVFAGGSSQWASRGAAWGSFAPAAPSSSRLTIEPAEVETLLHTQPPTEPMPKPVAEPAPAPAPAPEPSLPELTVVVAAELPRSPVRHALNKPEPEQTVVSTPTQRESAVVPMRVLDERGADKENEYSPAAKSLSASPTTQATAAAAAAAAVPNSPSITKRVRSHFDRCVAEFEKASGSGGGAAGMAANELVAMRKLLSYMAESLRSLECVKHLPPPQAQPAAPAAYSNLLIALADRLQNCQ